MLQSADKMEASRSMPPRSSMGDKSLQNGHSNPVGIQPPMCKARSSIPQHANQGFCIQPMSASDILSGSGNMSLPMAMGGDRDRISDDPFSPLFTSSSVGSILDDTRSTGSHMNGNHVNGSMNGNAAHFRATVGAYTGTQKIQNQQQLHHQQQQYLQQTHQGKIPYRQPLTTTRISGQNSNPIQNQLQQQHSRTHSQPNASHGKSSHAAGSQTLNTSFDLPSNSSNINAKK